MPNQSVGPTIDSPPRVPFVVDETPYCCWEWNLHDRNLEFLRGIDPGFYTYIVDAHAAHLDDADRRLKAAMAIRLTYAQTLETFFALVGAFVQAPDCVYGWLLRYKNHQLRSLVGKILRSEQVRSRLTIQPTWKSLSIGIHQQISCEPEKKEWIIDGFEKAWVRLAHDFLDDTANSEYNSAKHGLRTQFGGFSFAVGPAGTVSNSANTEGMMSLGGSEFGSSFHVLETFTGEKVNFRGRNVSRNWNPDNLIGRVYLLECSIGNVVTTLRRMNGENPEDCKFRYPQTPDVFDTPWATNPGVLSMNFDTLIDPNEIQPLSKDEILASYSRTDEEQTGNEQT